MNVCKENISFALQFRIYFFKTNTETKLSHFDQNTRGHQQPFKCIELRLFVVGDETINRHISCRQIIYNNKNYELITHLCPVSPYLIQYHDVIIVYLSLTLNITQKRLYFNPHLLRLMLYSRTYVLQQTARRAVCICSIGIMKLIKFKVNLGTNE